MIPLELINLFYTVKISNDYSEWPHSQIYLSSLAGMKSPSFLFLTATHKLELDTFILPKQPSREPEKEENFLSYAASLIEILRRQRDSERLAHARTRDLADTEIISLKAMLSTRDAELESYIVTGENIGAQRRNSGFTAIATNSRNGRERIPVDYEPISRDEIVSVLESTAARNNILETEVKILAERVSRIFLS